jgi:hypothetical protein
MNTVFVIVVVLGLFCWCGTGLSLFFIKERSISRLAAIPVIGLCAGVLFTLFLARFGLHGRAIAVVTMLSFGGLNAAAFLCCRPRPSGLDVLSALPVALCCAGGLAIAGWPLLQAGMENYWGFANPDHAFYIPVIEYLDSHSFRVAPSEFLGVFSSLGEREILAISYDSSVILGLSYFFSMVSLVCGVPVSLLFGVFTAASASIVPASVYVLCDLGLLLPKRFSIAAAVLTACSAITAYTFYLHSLGTMTVIAIVPVGTALVLDYLRHPEPRRLIVSLIVVAGMYYNYFPGFAILMISVCAAIIVTLANRRRAMASILIFSGALAIVLFSVSTSHALIILRRLIQESTSGRLASSEELLVTFSLVLTERGLPFFWGLLTPFGNSVPLFGASPFGFYFFLLLGAAMFVILGIALVRRVSGICTEFTSGVVALLLLLILYAVTGNGYGGFKVVAYMHGLALAGLAGSGLALAHRLWNAGHRVSSLAPAALLIAFAGFNIANSLTLGRDSLGNRGGMNNAPGLRLKDFRELRAVAAAWGQQGIIIAMPDSVTQNWLVPFMRSSVAEFFPRIQLNVEDSSPRLFREAPVGRYVLHFADDSQELFGVRPKAALWQNDKFALTPLAECRDFMFFGRGWYRKESVNNSPYEWQRHFRWLRRRGELLILNPSQKAKRLLITMEVGYGGTTHTRHVEMFLNGAKFDEVEFAGQAKVLTRPFTPQGPWSQVEVAVRETVSQSPRDHALWNRWVPGDSRHLNIAVSDIALIDAAQTDSVSESAVEFGAGKRMTALTRGVYPDGWAGEAAQASLRVPDSVTALEISGTIPRVSAFRFPYVIPVSIDGVPVHGARVEQAGSFNIRLPLERQKLISGQSALLKLGPLPTFLETSNGTQQVPRSLSILLGRLALVTSSNAHAGFGTLDAARVRN